MPASTNQDELSAVALFPLPNVVLFPRAVLPLHIFEERYKLMVADTLRGRRRFAMALLQPGWEKNYHGRPPIEPVVCVGAILSHERLSDGKYNLLLQGQTRARILRETANGHYRTAALEPLPQQPVLEIDLDEQRRRLTEIFESGKLQATGIARQFRELLVSSVSTADIADLLAFNFLEDIELKQSLLADGDVRRRVSRLVDAFEAYSSVLQLTLAAGSNEPGLN